MLGVDGIVFLASCWSPGRAWSVGAVPKLVWRSATSVRSWRAASTRTAVAGLGRAGRGVRGVRGVVRCRMEKEGGPGEVSVDGGDGVLCARVARPCTLWRGQVARTSCVPERGRRVCVQGVHEHDQESEGESGDMVG